MKMSIEEAIGMRGTEFTYVLNDGDTMLGYVKDFVPEKGLSCWSMSMVTDEGFEFEPHNDDEKAEGAICIVAINLIKTPDKLYRALEILEEIKLTGKKVALPITGGFAGCPL